MSLIRFIQRHPFFSAFVALLTTAIVAGWLLVTFWETIKVALADQLIFSLLLMAAMFGTVMTAVAYFILLERKISAWMQDRYGPNRVGPLGLLQPLADGVKLLLKEDIIPRHVDRGLFIIAPMIGFVIALLGFAIVPWGGAFRWPWMEAGETIDAQIASVDVGLLYILAIGSMGVYGVVLGGWASNNKYAFYGGMRAAAQMLSYEIPLGMMVLVGILATQALRLETMVAVQAQPLLWLDGFNWMFFYHPVAAIVMFITALAEANRAPFDLAEAEQELIGGFHTEYSGMKWAMFFLGEYAHMFTSSALMVAIFFGGYLVPGWAWLNTSTDWPAMLLRVGVYLAKIVLFISFYMAVRWTLPRFRFDQLMRVAWKGLVPIGILLIALQVLIIYYEWPMWIAPIGNVIVVALALVAAQAGPSRITGRQLSLVRREQAVRRGEAVAGHV